MVTKREQVGAQCNAIVMQAEALAGVYRDYAALFHGGAGEEILDIVGKRTAELMELLGDVLNGMDAVTDEDAVLEPIFERAHIMFPVSPNV